MNCTFHSHLRQSTEASVDVDSTKMNTAGTEPSNEDSTLFSASDNPGFLAEESMPKQRERHSHDWLSDLTITPSKPAPTDEIRPLNSGMAAINELLLAQSSSLEWAAEGSEDLQKWLDNCIEAFFTGFHLIWPILNAPSWDATTASLDLSATICVMGTWLREGGQGEECHSALLVHEVLLQRLLQKLASIEVS